MATPAENLERVTDGSEAGSGQAAAPSQPASAVPSSPPAFDPAGDVMRQAQDIARGAMDEVRQANVGGETPPAAAPVAPEQPPTAPPTPAEPPVPTEQPTPEPPKQDAMPSPPAPHSYERLEEIAQLPEAERAVAAVEWAKAHASYDPIVYGLERYATYEANRELIQQWAIEDVLAGAGMPADVIPAKATEFVDWVKAGAQALPTPNLPPPFPAFPTPDEDGMVVIGGVQYDLNNEFQKQAAQEAYDDKKFIYDAKIEKQQAEAVKAREAEAQAAKQKQEQSDAIARQIDQRHEEFGRARVSALESVLTPIMPDFSKIEGGTLIESAYIHTIRGMLQQMEDSVDARGNPTTELGRLSKAARQYVQAGAGRAAEIGAAIDRITAIEARKVVDQLNRFFLKANKAEIALTSSQPQVPIAPVNVQTPSAPTYAVPQTFEDALNQARQIAREVVRPN